MRIQIAPLSGAGLLLLIGLNVWLLTEVVANFYPGDQGAGAKAEWTPAWPKSIDAPPTRRLIDNYKLTLAHPVFFKKREPFVPPPPPPPPPQVTSPPVVVDPGLALGGIIINSAVKKVYLFTKADPRGEWRQEGEMFLGWTVQSVDASTARLRQHDRTLELRLYPRN
jgi:hypothetical protein